MNSFILPYFDYCLSLAIYFNSAAINKLSRAYYSCLFKLFKFNFVNLTSKQINSELKQYNIFSFHHRLVFRLTIFLFKIRNSKVAPHQLREWLQPVTMENSRYNFRSNLKVVILADRSCLKYGVFSDYLNRINFLKYDINFKVFYLKLIENIDFNLNIFLNVLPKFNIDNKFNVSLNSH